MRPPLPPLLAATLIAVAVPAVAAVCTAASGEQQATLVELFTSEGCNSCPPADAWLSRLAGREGVVPLAFHVDYWDRLGWTDRFAAPGWTAHQQARATREGLSYLYTPQVVANGRSIRPSDQGVSGLARPARADLRLAVDATAGTATVDAALRGGAPARGVQVWLAVFESELSTDVRAGENAGRVLRHDFVVRERLGPWPLDAAGRAARAVRVGPLPGRGGVAAVVERDGEILQALAVDCPARAAH